MISTLVLLTVVGGLCLTCSLLTLSLNRFDSRDQSAVFSYFAWSVQSLGLRLKPETEQGLRRLFCGRIELLVTHFAKFSVTAHVCMSLVQTENSFRRWIAAVVMHATRLWHVSRTRRTGVPQNGLSQEACWPNVQNTLLPAVP